MRVCRSVPAGRRRRFVKLATAVRLRARLPRLGRARTGLRRPPQLLVGPGRQPLGRVDRGAAGGALWHEPDRGRLRKRRRLRPHSDRGRRFSYTELHAFSGTDGETPSARLLLAATATSMARRTPGASISEGPFSASTPPGSSRLCGRSRARMAKGRTAFSFRGPMARFTARRLPAAWPTGARCSASTRRRPFGPPRFSQR